MPNPFTRLPRNQSTQDSDRPVSITPVPERVRGHNNPYRGMEAHGVDPNNDTHDVEDYGWMEKERGVVVSYEPAPDPVDPIPVIVVQGQGRELKRFRVTRVTADGTGGQPKSMLGRDAKRRSVIIKNTSADPVYIGHDQMSASPMHGFPLAQNETLTMNGTEPFFAQSSTTNPCVLALYIDFVGVVNGESSTVRG